MTTKQAKVPTATADFSNLEVPDDFVRGVMFNLGQQMLRTYDTLSESHPGWANYVLFQYQLLDDVFGAKE